ncbi:MAG: hypothetical protein E7539_02670 [Ruminococcaceae bacterium]|nr:hypothetical protein [Oscillospiraceae bacterium]
MFEFKIKLADKLILLKSRFEFSRDFCRDYLFDFACAPDITAQVSFNEVEEEMSAAEVAVTPQYAECLCLYRKIAEKLPLFDRCVMHGAAIEYGGSAFIFTAPSGVGKTTHIKLWKKYLGEKVSIINGDKPILKIKNDDVTVFSSAWAGKEKMQSNTSAPLKAICLLKRAAQNKIYKVNPKQHLAAILNQIYLPKDEQSAEKNLQLFSQLLEQTPIYILECDISQAAVKTSFEELTGRKFLIKEQNNEN